MSSLGDDGGRKRGGEGTLSVWKGLVYVYGKIFVFTLVRYVQQDVQKKKEIE